MENILLLSCALIVFHIICPMIIGILSSKDITFNYLFSSRDTEVKTSIFFERSKRTFINLLETFPIFLILMVLSIFKGVDNYNLGMFWLILRFIYIPLYVLNFKYIRTLIWASSFLLLILMLFKFL